MHFQFQPNLLTCFLVKNVWDSLLDWFPYNLVCHLSVLILIIGDWVSDYFVTGLVDVVPSVL